QAEDGIRDFHVTGVQTCALPICGVGCEVDLGDDAFTALFSESAARAVVSVRPEHETALVDLCAKHGVPVRRLGTVGGSALTMVHRTGRISIEVAELRDAYESTRPALFGNKKFVVRPGPAALGPGQACGRGSCGVQTGQRL